MFFNEIFKKLKEKFGETSAHLVQTFFVYGFISLSLFVIKIIIARLYGQEELGTFTYFFSLVSLIFLFTSFGFPEAIAQIVVKEPKKLRSLMRYYVPMILFTTIFFLFIFLLATHFIRLNPIVSYFGTAIVLYIASYTFFYTLYSILRGFREFALASFYSLLNRIFFIVFIILLFLVSADFITVLLSMSVALVFAGIFALPKVKNYFSEEEEKAGAVNFVKLAFSLFLMQVSIYSLRFLSEIIIGKYVDLNSLGLYSAHSSITNTIRLVAYVLPVVILPMAVVSKYKLKSSLKKILLVLAPFSVIVLAATYLLVPLFFGEGYENAYLPVFLVLSSFLLVIYSYFNSVFVGENNLSLFYLKILGLDVFLSLVVNALLNIFLIIKLGIVGAPIATSITIIFKIGLNILAIKRLRIIKKV